MSIYETDDTARPLRRQASPIDHAHSGHVRSFASATWICKWHRCTAWIYDVRAILSWRSNWKTISSLVICKENRINGILGNFCSNSLERFKREVQLSTVITW